MKKKSQLLVALLVFGAAAISNLAGAGDTPAAAKNLAPPKTPGKLKAATASFFQINLSWSDKSANEAGFKIERSTDGKHFTQIAQVLPNTTAYRDTGLFPGSSYVYRVRAFNAAGDSKYSNDRKARTLSARTLALPEWGGISGAPLGESNWVAVAAGGYHGLALRADGTVAGWGDYNYGPASPPTNLTSVTAIAAGMYHSLALTTDGMVVGWGYDGNGAATPPADLTHVVAIAAGDAHSLALKNDGTVVQWGGLGFGGYPSGPLSNLTGVVAIACGGWHSLALKSDGTVIGWGDNNRYRQATPPTNLTQVVAIAAGGDHSLALKSDGTVVGWGNNDDGEAMPPTNLTRVVAIAAGWYYSLAVKDDGSVVSWGYDGNETATPAGLSGVVAISARASHNLALSTAPAAPSEVTAKVISASQIVLSWLDDSRDNHRSRKHSFKVERALEDGFFNLGEWTQIAVVSAGKTNFSDSNVTTNATYWYRVSAFDASGSSIFSAPIAVRIAPLAAPDSLTANLNISNGVDLSWYEWPAGSDGFKVERAPDVSGVPGTWIQIAIAKATNVNTYPYFYTYFTDTNIAINTTYWYRVRAFNVVDTSPYADPVSLSVVPPNAPYIYQLSAFADTASLYWYDYSQVAGFKIERAPDAGGNPGTWLEITNFGPYFNFYTDTGLSANTTYWYRVRAYNWVGDSDYTSPASVNIVPPAAPNSMAAYIGFTNNVDVSWNENLGDQDGFKLERAPDAGGSPGAWIEIASLSISNTSSAYFSDTNVPANSAYWYRVRAFNVLGYSDYSAAASVNLAPPAAPMGLNATPFVNRVNLSWYVGFPGATGFKIERALDVNGAPGAWVQIAALDPTYFSYGSFADTNRAADTTYWYRVRAFNWIGDSPYSDPAVVTIVPPAAPFNLYAVLGDTNQATLSWHDYANDEDGFIVEWAPDIGGGPGAWTQIAVINSGNAYYGDFTDTNVTAYTTNWYRVRAFNVVGVSDYSAAVSLNAVPPAAPTALNATPFANRVNLSWNAGSTGLMGFKLERAPDADGIPGTWAQIARLDSANYNYSGYTDTNRAADTTYWYRVRAFNWIGDSPYSDPAVVTIVPPAKPADLTAAIGDTNQVALSWNDSATDEDGFTVERAPDIGGGPGAWTQITVINSGNVYYGNYTDTNATANTTNWYRVRAFNVVGVSDYSTAVHIYLVPPAAPTALNATPLVNRVNLYWNAASGGVMGFKVERAPDADGAPGTWAQIAMLDPSSNYATAYTDTNRAADTTYWYRVRAFNWIGNSPYCDPAVVTIVPPSTPSYLSAVLGNANQAVLSWYDSAADEDGFTMERAPDIGGGPGAWMQLAVINSGNGYNGNYTDTNVTANTTNWYRVRAFNVVGVSDYTVPAIVAIVPPVAPALSANATGNRANLSWYGADADSAAITAFQIERAPDAGSNPGTWAKIATVNGGYADNNFTDPGRATGTTSWYRVRAFNWVGGSPYSAPASVTIIPPATPNNLSGIIGATNQVNLFWYDYSEDEDGFKIERAPDTDGSPGLWTEIASINATNLFYVSFTDTNVTANTTNWYRVRAFRAADISPYSDPASVAVVPPPAPYLTAYPFINRANLSWYVYAAAISGFKIERAPDAGGNPGTWTEIINTPNTSCTDSNLAANATYWYRTRAYNWIGDSPFSDPVSVTIVPPAMPYYLNGTVGTTNQVNLFWSDYSQDEDGFKIERASDAGGNPGSWTEIGTIYATNFYYGNFTDTNATANTTNWYRVRAFNVIGISDYSFPASVSIVPPDAPNHINAYPFKNSISINWYEYYNGLIGGFKIERALDAGGSPGTWTAIATNTGSLNSYTDLGLTVNNKYWYRVRAFNWVGDSPYSSTASAMIKPPARPVVSASVGMAGQVNLAWYDNASDEDGIKFERAPDVAGGPGAWTEIGTLNATNNYSGYFADTTVTANTTNWYRIRAFNVLGISGYSPTSSVSIIPPEAPSDLAGTVASIHRIDLSWHDYNSVIEGYKIERAPDNDGAPGTWTQINVSSYSYYYGSYADLAVTTNKIYWYRVRAFNWVGDSPYSAAIVVNDATPAAPVSLTAVNDFRNQIALAWTGSSTNASGFKIERAVDLGGAPASWIQIANLSGSATSFTDTGLVTGKTYWYRVRAFNNSGNSPYSNEASARIREGQFVRVMQWNVEKGLGRVENNYNYQPQAIARIVNYNQPDVLLFCEVDAQNLTAAQNQDAIINWVTNNVPYLGTQPGVSFYVAVSSKSDGFNRNAVVSRYPIAGETTYDDGLRGLHSFQVQFSDANSLQVFHTHLKCCADDCTRKQIEAQFDAGVIAAFALTNSLPYLFAGDWNEDEQNYECTPSSTYHPIQTIREGASLVEFKPTTLSGDYRTWSSQAASPSIRFDYVLAATNRLSPGSGYVFSSVDWQDHGIYGNFYGNDSYYASDHYCVFANYFFGNPALVVTPPDTLASAGFQGGPFVHTNLTYLVSNSAAGPVDWTIGKSAAWVSVSADAGTLGSGATMNITVSINTNANTLATGAYSDAISFSNTTSGNIEATRAVHLTVNDPALLAVTPASGLAALGIIGGPFNPSQQTYTLSNAGIATLTWTADHTANWVAISATNGTLAVGATTNVVVSFSSNAASLAAANYSDTVTFANTTSAAGSTTRSVNLTVTGFGFYDDFSTFPAGNLVGQKAWAQALASSSLPQKISGGRLVVPSPQSGDNQDAYKNFTVTSATLFYGMTLIVNNAPTGASPSYFAALYSGNNAGGFANFRLTAKDNGAGTFVLGARITGQAGDPYTFGSIGLQYGTQHRVIVEADSAGSVMKIFVDPPSPDLPDQTPYLVHYIGSGTPPAQSGSFVFSQFNSASAPVVGFTVGKIVVIDNFATVFNDLADAPAPLVLFDRSLANTVIDVQPFQITSILPTNDDVLITWLTTGGTTNAIQAAPNAMGAYTDISPDILILGNGSSTTSYLDSGTLTNTSSRFYRIRRVP
ncbi:MAG TPA: hypothetical protein VNN22_20425 [Verrucomicrobiae bacterium]|nr:hypothetical protein [Verrucomicrobiae bacterium]